MQAWDNDDLIDVQDLLSTFLDCYVEHIHFALHLPYNNRRALCMIENGSLTPKYILHMFSSGRVAHVDVYDMLKSLIGQEVAAEDDIDEYADHNDKLFMLSLMKYFKVRHVVTLSGEVRADWG